MLNQEDADFKLVSGLIEIRWIYSQGHKDREKAQVPQYLDPILIKSMHYGKRGVSGYDEYGVQHIDINNVRGEISPASVASYRKFVELVGQAKLEARQPVGKHTEAEAARIDGATQPAR